MIICRFPGCSFAIEAGTGFGVQDTVIPSPAWDGYRFAGKQHHHHHEHHPLGSFKLEALIADLGSPSNQSAPLRRRLLDETGLTVIEAVCNCSMCSAVMQPCRHACKVPWSKVQAWHRRRQLIPCWCACLTLAFSAADDRQTS